MKTNQIGYIAPSNIALIKYWGKHSNQLPCNPSISFSLKHSVTKTTAEFTAKADKNISLDFNFKEKAADGFSTKINKYFEKIKNETNVVLDYHFKISSENTFPHSAGIASSASSMASLALIIASLEKDQKDFYQRAAYLARIGSGSATRSVYGGFVSWGKNSFLESASDEHGTSIDHLVHPDFKRMGDAILIVDSNQKKISSSQGHELMKTNPYRETRFLQAHANYNECLGALKTGDWEKLAEVVEREALSLHALMMMSKPSFILLHPNSLRLIELINDFKMSSKLPVSYTIDAGPNIHLLYDTRYKNKVMDFVKQVLTPYLENGRFIDDERGEGPARL